MRAEYRFDYAKAKPNRLVSKMENGAVAVILDPDVASVFRSSMRSTHSSDLSSQQCLRQDTRARKPVKQLRQLGSERSCA